MRPVQLVDVHRVQAVLQSAGLGLEALDGFVVSLPLVVVALAQSFPDPVEHLRIECESVQQLGELPLERLFTDGTAQGTFACSRSSGSRRTAASSSLRRLRTRSAHS